MEQHSIPFLRQAAEEPSFAQGLHEDSLCSGETAAKSLQMPVGCVETICLERLNVYLFIDVRQGENCIS